MQGGADRTDDPFVLAVQRIIVIVQPVLDFQIRVGAGENKRGDAGPPCSYRTGSRPRHATAIIALHRRARDRAIGTEYATVASERLKPHPAAHAVIEEHAGIGRHGLDGPMTA